VEQRFSESTQSWSEDEASAVAREVFAVDGVASRLGSERDENFRISTPEREYVLKVTHPAEPDDVTRFHAALQRHLHDAGASVPALFATRDGTLVHMQPGHGVVQAVRLIEHIPGLPMALSARSAGQRHALGSALGRIDRALTTFAEPVPDLDILWDSGRVDRLARLVPHVSGDGRRSLVERELAAFVDDVLPAQASLPRQLIHNDGNPSNVIVDAEDPTRVRAVLDFGDVLVGPRVQELAVACAYSVEGTGHPLAAPADLVSGYHAEYPLSERELSLLPALMRARMLTTVLVTEWRASAFPANRDYILRNNPGAWSGLARLDGIDADEALEFLTAHLEEDR
jgi:Ser/Thr protein kinase RdoA (MazF antagonist)